MIGFNYALAAHDTHLVQSHLEVFGPFNFRLLCSCAVICDCRAWKPTFQAQANRMPSAVVAKRFVAK